LIFQRVEEEDFVLAELAEVEREVDGEVPRIELDDAVGFI